MLKRVVIVIIAIIIHIKWFLKREKDEYKTITTIMNINMW